MHGLLQSRSDRLNHLSSSAQYDSFWPLCNRQPMAMNFPDLAQHWLDELPSAAHQARFNTRRTISAAVIRFDFYPDAPRNKSLKHRIKTIILVGGDPDADRACARAS